MAVSYGSGGCGIFYSGHEGCTNAGDQLLAQILFVLAIIAWVSATMGLLLFVCKLILGASDYNWQAQGGKPGDEQSTPLAYTKSVQMLGMDEIGRDVEMDLARYVARHGGPGKLRGTVVGQQVMARPGP